MEHAAVALYIAVALGGSWIVVFSFLLYRRDRNPAYYYFGLVVGSAMVMLMLSLLVAYLVASGVEPPLWLGVVAEAADAVAELIQFYAMVRLAYAIVRLAVPRAIAAFQIVLMVIYATLIGYFAISRSSFEVRHVALGIAHLAFVAIIVLHRRRIASNVWRILVRFLLITAVFAPVIGLSIYTGIAQRIPLGDLAFQTLYMLIVVVLLNWYAIHYYFPRRCPDGHGCAEELGESLSRREEEVADLAGKGYTNKEIAALPHISPRTVTNHLYHVYQKLGVRNRVELRNEAERLS